MLKILSLRKFVLCKTPLERHKILEVFPTRYCSQAPNQNAVPHIEHIKTWTLKYKFLFKLMFHKKNINNTHLNLRRISRHSIENFTNFKLPPFDKGHHSQHTLTRTPTHTTGHHLGRFFNFEVCIMRRS